MITIHHIKRPEVDGLPLTSADCMNDGKLCRLLAHDVVGPFQRITGSKALVIPVNLNAREGEEDDPPLAPAHPECAGLPRSSHCQEAWRLYRAELRCCLRSYWHRCDYRRLCAVVPVVFHNHCPAVLKYVNLATRGQATFVRDVELLESLALGFVARHTAPDRGCASRDARAPVNTAGCDHATPQHPRVAEALECIEKHLSSQQLRLAEVARMVGLHPNYLSHLFVRQVGQRLCAYVNCRRMERAKNLLVGTDWQIKRIAHEVGHANPNWFSVLFHAYTGLTPTKYRRKAREVRPDESAS